MGNLTQLQQIGLGAQGAGVVGSAVSGFGQYESGQQQKQADDYNAAIAMQTTQQNMQTSGAKYSTLEGRQASLYAKAGVDIRSGSPLLMMAHTAAQNAIEQTSEYQAGSEQAAIDKYYGKVAAFNGTIGGIDTFLQGLSKGVAGSASILGPSNP